jgi:NitT/TauT family transport system substrate-binding protein
MYALLLVAVLAAINLPISTAAAQGIPLEKKSIHVAVGGKTLVAYLPLTIAERRGFFSREGLQVEISDVAGGAKAMQSLVGGSADIISGAYEHTILMAAKGIHVKAIALQNNSYGLVIGLPKERSISYSSPRDLKGLKIGVTAPGSASAMGVNLLLAKGGLSANDVSIIGVGGGPSAIAMMKSGQLDAMANFDPVISLLERDGLLTSVIDTRNEKDLDELYGGPFAASAFIVDVRFADQNPRTTQAFVNAVRSALEWMATASSDEIVASVPEEYYSGDRLLYRTVVEKNRGRFSRDGRISMAAARNVQRNLATFDDSLKNAQVDISRTFDNGFLAKAAEAK